MRKDTDIALVLPGGGSWIYAQAEALNVLMGEPAIAGNIRGIYANSAGSISGACLAGGLLAGVGTKLLMDALASVNRDEQIYTPGFTAIAAHPWAHPLDISKIGMGALTGASAFDQTPLWSLLQKHLGTRTSKDLADKLGIEFLVRGFDSKGKRGRVYCGQLWRMAAASSAIECAFKAHLGISDGGVVDNAPVDLAIDRGFKRILVVYCGPEGSLPDMMPVWIDDNTPEPPQPKCVEVAKNTLESLTMINEGMTAERIARWTGNGNCLVEAFPAQDVAMGSILDFSRAAQLPRIAGGHAAGALAVQNARLQGWC